MRQNYSVPGITCAHCVKTIERELTRVAGVTDVRADETQKAVTVEIDETDVLMDVESKLVEIGYPAARARVG